MPEPLLPIPILIIFCSALLTLTMPAIPVHRRLSTVQLSMFLALVPLAALVYFLIKIPALQANLVFTWEVAWIPSLGLRSCLYVDSLSTLFALLITFIGTLVIIYAGQYFKKDPGAWRFFAYILFFMGAMLGLVMAGDVLTLFVFWEGTSFASFLLVAYKSKDKIARQGAFKALLITAGGGIALLIGLLFITYITGDTRFITILDSGDALRGSGFYPFMLGLVALGAFTKSAQFPFHIWLPDAMSAPTPASAYLHSATMVKAGIYLMARLNPVLGMTETWFWLLTLAGMATMLTGAVIGLKKTDLKAVLAYSTICQLGILMMMIGQDMEISFKALVIGILAHALYKSALFLIVGIVEHETGTRDLQRLGGLRRTMPYTFTVALLAALSMAGLPPLFGFLAKETLLATAVHPSLPEVVAWVFVLSSILTGALMLAISARLIGDTFMGAPRDPAIHGHEAPFTTLLAPAIPAVLSLVLGQLPGPKQEAALLANAAGAAFGAKVKVSLALWTGLNIPLLLSMIAIGLGCAIFYYRQNVIGQLTRIRSKGTANHLFDWLIRGIDATAAKALYLQYGKLRFYLATILAATLILVFMFGGFPTQVDLALLSKPALTFTGELRLLRLAALFLILGTSIACVFLRNDFFAVLAFGASGLGVAVLMALQLAPDVALVQIVVDILLVIILVLTLSRLPRNKLIRIQKISFYRSWPVLTRDAIISSVFGLIVMLMSLEAILSRPRHSFLTPYFETNAKPATGAKSIVGAILTDFRGIDTLIEIVVFSIAGIGIFTLLTFAAAKFKKDRSGPRSSAIQPAADVKTLGVGGTQTSPSIRVLAHVVLPLALAIGACELLYGHVQPGDGFTAGVIVSIGIGFWYVAFGYEETRQRLIWLKPSLLISCGILLAILSAVGAAITTGTFFANVDFGHLAGIPLPKNVHLSTSFIFECAIGLSVVGSVTHMLNALGHPEEMELPWKS